MAQKYHIYIYVSTRAIEKKSFVCLILDISAGQPQSRQYQGLNLNGSSLTFCRLFDFVNLNRRPTTLGAFPFSFSIISSPPKKVVQFFPRGFDTYHFELSKRWLPSLPWLSDEWCLAKSEIIIINGAP